MTPGSGDLGGQRREKEKRAEKERTILQSRKARVRRPDENYRKSNVGRSEIKSFLEAGPHKISGKGEKSLGDALRDNLHEISAR